MQDQLQGHSRPAQAAARPGEMRRVPARFPASTTCATSTLRQAAPEGGGWRHHAGPDAAVPAGPPGTPGERPRAPGTAAIAGARPAVQQARATALAPASPSRPLIRPPHPAAPQTIIAADEDLKTAFFLPDSTFGPYSQTRAEDVVPPRSIVARDGPSHPGRCRAASAGSHGDEAGARRAPAEADLACGAVGLTASAQGRRPARRRRGGRS